VQNLWTLPSKPSSIVDRVHARSNTLETPLRRVEALEVVDGFLLLRTLRSLP
jgi:hypothetical protein